MFNDCYEMFNTHWDYNDISFFQKICRIENKTEALQHVKDLQYWSNKGYKSIMFWQTLCDGIYRLKKIKNNFIVLYNESIICKNMPLDETVEYLYKNKTTFNEGLAVLIKGFGLNCEVGCIYNECAINPMVHILKLKALRNKAIRKGMKLLSEDEILKLIENRRSGREEL